MKIRSIFDLTNKKVFFISITILIIYNLFSLESFLQNTNGLNFNIYDYLIYIFNDLYFVFFIIFLTTIILLYKIIDNIHLKKYIIMKFPNRKNWLFHNILYIIAVDFSLIIFIVITSIFQLINKTNFINSWSKYGLYKYQNTNLIKYTPLTLTLKSLVSIFMYIFIIGFFIVMLNLYLKKSSVVLNIVLIFNLFNISIFLAKIKFFYPISMVHNTLLIYQVNLNSYIYWMLLTMIFIVLSIYKLKKIDF